MVHLRNQLSADNVQLKRKCEQFSKDNDELKCRLSCEINEKLALKDTKEKLEKDLDTFKSDLKTSKDENIGLKDDLDSMTQRRNILHKSEELSTSLNAGLEGKVRNLTAIKDNMVVEQVKLLENMSSLNNELTQQCDKVAKCKENCAKLTLEKSDLQNEVRSTTSQLIVNKTMNEGLQNELKNKCSELQEVRLILERSVTEGDELKLKRSNLEAQVVGLEVKLTCNLEEQLKEKDRFTTEVCSIRLFF